MLVKCRLCGAKVERKNAFKVVVGNKNAYYCNEAEYQKVLHNREVKDNTYTCINEIFGYKVLNSALFKEINLLLETYSYEHILAYLMENKNYITKVLEKDFVSEYAKIRYFSAIIKNNIADFKMKEPEKPREIDVDMPIRNYKRKNKRRSLEEIEQKVGE